MQGFFSAGFGGEPPPQTKAPRQAPRALADPRSGSGGGASGGSGSVTVKKEPADDGAASALEKSHVSSAAKVPAFRRTPHFILTGFSSQSRQYSYSLHGHKCTLTRLMTSTITEKGIRKETGQGGVGRCG